MPGSLLAVPGAKVVKALGRAGFTVVRISGSRAAGCYCAAAIHPARTRELLEDLTDGAAACGLLEEHGDDTPARQVWTELA